MRVLPVSGTEGLTRGGASPLPPSLLEIFQLLEDMMMVLTRYQDAHALTLDLQPSELWEAVGSLFFAC